MSKFFFNLKENPDIFEKTQHLVNKDTKSISYEGLNYRNTKDLSLKELLFFIERDIGFSIKKGGLPPLKIRFEVSKEKGKDYISVTIFEIQTDGFYDKKGTPFLFQRI